MFSLTREPNVAISLNEYHRWQIQFLRWILLYIGTKLIFAKKCWIFKYNIHHQNSLNAHSIWYTVSNSLYLTLFKDNGGKADILRQMDPINSNQLIQPNPFMKQSHDHEPSIANHRQEEVQYIQAPSIHRKLIHSLSVTSCHYLKRNHSHVYHIHVMFVDRKTLILKTPSLNWKWR